MRCSNCSAANPSGMRFCGKCGSPLRGTGSGRERRNVSVVFIDLSGFSNLTRDWSPEQLRDLADEILTVVAGVVEDYDGYVDAFQGDGLIALFGAPRSHSDDPHRAVLAARAGLKAIEAIGRSKGLDLKGRAGVNTGVVIAGSIGLGRVRDYTVMGSAVNLAARLETAATPGEVWVGPETFEATRHRVTFETVSGLTLAGFPNVTEAYKLVSTNADGDSDPYANLRFVGREQERRQLTDAFQSVTRANHAQTLWLVGEAGIGKTRLVREFASELSAAGRAKVLWVDEKASDTDLTWRQLAGALFDLSLSDDERKWRHVVSAQLADLLPAEPRWQTYILNSLGVGEDKPWTRRERRTADRIFVAWRDLLLAFVNSRLTSEGLVLVVEHGSQNTAFSAFPRLLAESAAPMLLLRISRGYDALEAALPGARESRLSLRPLNLEESLALVEQVANPVLKVATESLVFQVGGVPANLLELGRALSITPQGSFAGSLASLLQARLDMLSSTARRLLALAALSGERFWNDLVAEVAEVDEAEPLSELTREKLVFKEPTSLIPGFDEYRFQSELVRRAVLRMIPFSERPLLHLNLASWLERHAPLSLSELVGYHFKEGGSAEAAYPHYLAAADLAVSEGEVERAFQLFDTLLALETAPHLLAQAALVYAQAALGACETRRAVDQLGAADQWIELSTSEGREALRGVHQQLCAEVQDKL